MPVNTGYLSGDTTNFSSISLTGAGNLLASQVSAPVVAVGGGPILNTTGVDVRTNAGAISVASFATTGGMTIGQLRVVFAASGVSLIFSSGVSTYIVAGSAVSGTQA